MLYLGEGVKEEGIAEDKRTFVCAGLEDIITVYDVKRTQRIRNLIRALGDKKLLSKEEKCEILERLLRRGVPLRIPEPLSISKGDAIMRMREAWRLRRIDMFAAAINVLAFLS